MLCAFDFDGTLADSKAAYYTTVKQYAEKNSFPLPSEHEMNMAFGNPNPPFFKNWADPSAFQHHLETIFLMVDDILCENPSCMPLYDEVFELLEALVSQGNVLSIVTSRNLKPLLAVLKAHKIESFFKSIRSAQDMIDRGYRGKPHPDKLECVLREFHCHPSNAIMVGDTSMDMQMANRAGVFALGVAWGYHDEQTLLHNADKIVFYPREIKEVIKTKQKASSPA